MIIKSNNETIYNKVVGAIMKMSSNPDEAIFAFTLIGVPIEIDVDNKMEGVDNGVDTAIYTDGRGIVIKGNIVKINDIFNVYGATNVLKHELEHIILNHIFRQKEVIDAYSKYSKNDISKIFNVAADYIINKDLKNGDNATRDLQFVNDSFMRTVFNLSSDELKNKSVEEIVVMIMKGLNADKLNETMEFIRKESKGDGFGGNSSFSHMSSDENKSFDDFVKKNSNKFGGDYFKYIEDLLKNAITSYGCGQSGMWKKLNRIYGKPYIDWNSVLSSEIKQYKTRDISENGLKAVNRRYYQLSAYVKSPILFTNFKKTFKDGIIAIDTSGSISDDIYVKEVFEAIRLVSGEGIDWTIMLFDDGIVLDEDGNPVMYKTSTISTKDLTEKLLNRTYGGTDIKEVLDYANSSKAKFLILISDMEFNYDLPDYKSFRKIFISTSTADETDGDVRKICDVLAFFNPY